MQYTLDQVCELLQNDKPLKIIISKPTNQNTSFHKLVLEQKQNNYLLSQYTEKQVFHKNIPFTDLHIFLLDVLQKAFLQLNAFGEDYEAIVLLSKKGTITFKKKQVKQSNLKQNLTSHNREKNYILKEGTIIPPLIDMGIFTKDGKIVRSMYDKFRQINRFIELVNDSVSSLSHKEELHIIDFGCGKSYLTFILYYYFTEIQKMKVSIVGLDLKADVIAKCNQTAQKYGYTGLHFELGDINGYHSDMPVDMVVTLHACDTATDYALMNAIEWNAKMIFSVPCCQHEWNQTMKSDHFSLISRYGILQERFSALATDAVRANLLECVGYKTQLLEFVDFDSTPKNLLIRATFKPLGAKTSKMKEFLEVKAFLDEFHTEPTLYRLLKEKGYLNSYIND